MAEEWIIRVVNDTVGDPTSINLAEQASGDELALAPNDGPSIDEKEKTSFDKLVGFAVLGIHKVIKATQTLLNFTGRKTRAKAISTGTKYAGVALGGGYFGGPIGSAIAVGATFANDAVNYELSILEENANARYLREATNTRHNNGQGEYYSLKL